MEFEIVLNMNKCIIFIHKSKLWNWKPSLLNNWKNSEISMATNDGDNEQLINLKVRHKIAIFSKSAH